MEYQNVNPPNILHVAIGAAAPQHGRDATFYEKLSSYVSEDPVISVVALFTTVSVCLLSAGTSNAASSGVDVVYIFISVIAILVTQGAAVTVLICSYARLLPGLICTAFFLCSFGGCLDLVVVLLEQLGDKPQDIWRVGAICAIASQILLFLASLARHCALRRLPQHGQHARTNNNSNDNVATITASMPPTIATVPGYLSTSMLQHNGGMPNSGSHSQLTPVVSTTMASNAPAPATNTNTPTNNGSSDNNNNNDNGNNKQADNNNSMTYHEPAASLSPVISQPNDYQNEIALTSVTVTTHSTTSSGSIDDDNNEPNTITIRGE